MNKNKFLTVFVFSLFLSACGGSSDKKDDNGSANAKPSVDAGSDIDADAFEPVTLEGSGSDSDGSIVSWTWSQVDGPAVTLSGDDSATAEFEAPAVETLTELVFELTATDDGGETASDTVTVNVAPVVTMSGRIYDGPIAGATVTVQVGDRTYTAVSDDDGNYSVNIGSPAPDAFVTLRAVGGEGQEHVELLGIAASFGQLQTLAGSDGKLLPEESSVVNVTNLSTAKVVLMMEANGGQPITSDDAAKDLETRVNGDDLMRLATVIKLVIDGGFDLPAGTTNTVALVSDRDTVNSFVDTVNSTDPTAYESIQDEMLNDPELTTGFTRAPDAYNLLIVDTLNSTGTIEYMLVNRAPRYEFNTDGSGHVYGSSVGTTRPFEWVLQGRDLVISYDSPLLPSGYCYVEGQAGQFLCETTIEEERMSLVFDGVNTDHVRIYSEGVRRYPNNPEFDPIGVSGSSVYVAMTEQLPVELASEAGNVWAFTVAGPNTTGLGLSTLSAGRLQVDGDTGTTIASEFSPAIAFSHDTDADGTMNFEYADGASMNVRALRKEGIAYDAQMMFTTSTGEMYTDGGLIVRDDGSAEILADKGWVGSYTLYGQDAYFDIELKADGSGEIRSYFDNGTWNTFPLRWALDAEGSIVISQYSAWIEANMQWENVASCDGHLDCYAWKERIWTPVAFDEAKKRLFVTETQQEFWYDAEMPDKQQESPHWMQTGVRFWGYEDAAPAVTAKVSATASPRATAWKDIAKGNGPQRQ